MDETLKPTKTVYTVSQFLDWQRQRTLNLNPIFQRRPVWKTPAKSQLIDSVVRGYPVPIILLRQVQDLDTLQLKMEVVDGQQRLRTLLSFIDPASIPDLRQNDQFTVRRTHNRDIAGKAFSALSADVKQTLLSYEISTHVFPATTGDEQVFRIFARLNSTGLSLNDQEIRNSEFHGAFKSLVYELSFEYLDSWREWNVFPSDAISRMEEAEAVSEYIIAMVEGIGGKSKSRITKYYRDNEDEFSDAEIVRHRFETTMTAIQHQFGGFIRGSAFERASLFYSLFAAVYHHMYGLASPLRRKKPRALPRAVGAALSRASDRIRSKKLPEDVQDAMDKATADKARRDRRHKFIMGALGLEPAN